MVVSLLASFIHSTSLGKPSDDPLHVDLDYVPSIFVFKQNARSQSERQNEQHLRLQQRREKVAELEATTAAAEALVNMNVESPNVHGSATTNVSTQTVSASTVAQCVQVCTPAQAVYVQACPSIIGKSVQTDLHGLKCFGALFIEGNDSMTKFYTGLPSWDVFEHVYSILISHVPKKWSANSKLQPRDELLLVLVRLHLNLLLEDIAYWFGIAKSTVTIYYNKFMD